MKTSKGEIITGRRLIEARRAACEIAIEQLQDPPRCNDPKGYAIELKKSICRIMSGKSDNNFTIWQRMDYYLTGNSIPFLPKYTRGVK